MLQSVTWYCFWSWVLDQPTTSFMTNSCFENFAWLTVEMTVRHVNICQEQMLVWVRCKRVEICVFARIHTVVVEDTGWRMTQKTQTWRHRQRKDRISTRYQLTKFYYSTQYTESITYAVQGIEKETGKSTRETAPRVEKQPHGQNIFKAVELMTVTMAYPHSYQRTFLF